MRTSAPFWRRPEFLAWQSRSIWTKSCGSSSESSRAPPARLVWPHPGDGMSAERARTVLVVDDDDEVRELIAQDLRAHGFEVIEAANGFDALLQVMRARPDIVVLDLLMPRLGGLEALKQIRESAPDTVVVGVTGTDDPRLAAQALLLGAADVLAKPLDLARLRDVLARTPAPRPKAPPADRSTRAQPDAGTSAAGRVLIVDDDPEVSAVLEEFLAEHGYATRSAGDAPGAFWAMMQE